MLPTGRKPRQRRGDRGGMRLQVSCCAKLPLKVRILMRTTTVIAMASIIESKKAV
jgi:hypothetical protein